MNEPSLPSDDLPAARSTSVDQMLRRELEEATSRCFYKACDRSLQNLLSSCDWYITTSCSTLILVIVCSNRVTNWRVLNNLVQIGNQLARFSIRAKMRVYPPIGRGTPFEMRVDEIPIYRDSLSGGADS